MPLIETESLVLKSYNLAEADKIVVLLTRDHGVVRGVAKGAKRLKSRFGSGLEPFSEIKVSYFEKENAELVSIQKVDLLKSNFTAAANPDFLQKFSYLGDILLSFAQPHDRDEKLYRMVRACVAAGADDPENSLPRVGVYFEMWLLKLAGFLPDWSRCNQCRRVLEAHEDANVQVNFQLLCANCRKAKSSRVMDGKTREIVAAVLKLSPVQFVSHAKDVDERLRDLSSTLKQLISTSIGREVPRETSLALKANQR
ncbi:MAG: DNA repair protein RecO [Pyrinomonadaceae bacterium]